MDTSDIKFIYIHIPRCAGTTNRDSFRGTFGVKRVYRDLSFKKEPRLYSKKNEGKKLLVNRFVLCDKIFQKRFESVNWKNHDIIFGHFTIRKYEFTGCPFVTFMRDPIERIVSEYSVLRRDKEKFENLSIVDFSYLQQNLMTWMTGGDINKFLFIGFVEEYEKSMVKLEEMLNTKLVRVNAKENHRNFKFPKYKLTVEEKEIIKSHNKLDIDLYNKAYERFL